MIRGKVPWPSLKGIAIILICLHTLSHRRNEQLNGFSILELLCWEEKSFQWSCYWFAIFIYQLSRDIFLFIAELRPDFVGTPETKAPLLEHPGGKMRYHWLPKV